MANKKISELESRASLSLSDLMAVGDPSTGYLYKTTISDLKTLTGAGVVSFNGRFGAVNPAEGDYTLTQLGDVIITSPSNGQVLKYNGSNWVNATEVAEADTLDTVTGRGNTTANSITVGSVTAAGLSNLLGQIKTFATTGNTYIGESPTSATDAGFKLDVFGSTRVDSLTVRSQTYPTYVLTISHIGVGRQRILGGYGNEWIEFGEGGNTLSLKANEIYYQSTNNSYSANAKILSAGLGGLTFEPTNFYQQGDTRYGFQFTGNYTAAIASSPSVLGLVRFNPSIGTSIGTIDGSILHITPTINTTGGTTNWSAILYNPTISGSTGLDHFFINAASGKVKLGDLAGTGSRMIVADANGVLSAQAIPSTSGFVQGTGTSGQVAYFNGTNSLTSNAAFAFTPTSQLLVNNSVTAASAIARGTNLTPTLTAAANNDVLVGLDINPTFTLGAFTGVTRTALRLTGDMVFASISSIGIRADVRGGLMWLGNAGITNSGTGSHAYQFTTNDTNAAGTMIVSQRNTSSTATTLQVQQLGTGLALHITNLGSSLFSSSITASGAFAQGLRIENTLVASANDNVLVGLDVNPTFTNGAFSNVSNVPIRISNVRGGLMWLGSSGTGNSGTGLQAYQFTTNDTTNIGTMVVSQRNASGSGTTLFVQQLGTGLGLNVNSGNTLLGTGSDAGFRLDVNGTVRVQGVITGSVAGGTLTLGAAAANTQAIVISGNFTSGGAISTSNANQRGYDARINVQDAGAFWATSIGNGQGVNTTNAFFRGTGSINYSNALVGSNFNGVLFDPTITAQVNTVIYAFRSTLAAATDRWNLYMSGTALNYLAGNLLLNTTTDAGFRLDVNGTTRLNGQITGPNGLIINNGAIQAYNHTLAVNQGTGSTFLEVIQSVAGGATTIRQSIWTTGGGSATQNQMLFSCFNGSGATPLLTLRGDGIVVFENSFTPTYNTSAYLAINSTTRGFLPPRMTATQRNAISSPATGLVVYDTTDNELDYHNGTAWQSLMTLGTQQTVTGFKQFSASRTASVGVAQGTLMTPTLTAAANNDVLVGLDISPTYTNGAFTGVVNTALRVTGNANITGDVKVKTLEVTNVGTDATSSGVSTYMRITVNGQNYLIPLHGTP